MCKELLCGDSVRVYLEVLIPVHLCVFSLARRFKHMCRCNNNDLRDASMCEMICVKP